MLQILELFGGIGSPRIALKRRKIPTKSIDYVEIDPKAVNSYNAIFANDLAYQTQSVVNWNLKPDVLIHGSPCQDNSVIGGQAGMEYKSGTRSSLMWETLTIIEQMGMWRPQIVIWENVPGVLRLKKSKGAFIKYLEQMESLGYVNSFEVLNAMDYGLPQNRNRVFCVSLLRNEAFNFNVLRKSAMRDIREFLEDDVGEEYTVTAPSMLKRIGKPLPGFGGYLPVIEDYAWTITTKQNRCPNSGVVPIGNDKFRLLTERECWRLQGYNDEEFKTAASVNGKTALYMQAGNSIPVQIFESLFEVLL